MIDDLSAADRSCHSPDSSGPRFLLHLAWSLTLFTTACQQHSPSTVPQGELAGRRPPRKDRLEEPRHLSTGQLTIWWDRVPENVQTASSVSPRASNIHPTDYTGPEACRRCHKQQHRLWSQHAHRRMNALADPQTVKGDFSGRATLDSLDGRATFFRVGDGFRMRLVRGPIAREYTIHQTIGSRFFQYYVGTLVAGPEPPEHKFYHLDHVLPFGYWLSEKLWVPVVHLGHERPDEQRADPFVQPSIEPPFFAEYSYSCNYCHTTFPLGDMLLRAPQLIGQHAPVNLHFWAPDYLQHTHPQLWDGRRDPTRLPDRERYQLLQAVQGFSATRHAVSLGISCEACHLGSSEHAANPEIKPRFFPAAPELFVENEGTEVDYGRTHRNVNWACGRCHAGTRPEFAGGYATWNSIEFTDAQRGSCYSQLRCIDCHDPHTAIGQRWTRTPAQDEQVCLGCHQQFRDKTALVAHTHHARQSEGSRCLNCHMPRINEGLQDVVRTHTIHSPTKPELIEANHPNACNLCHPDRSIDWSLGRLTEWYGSSFSETRLQRNYPHRDGPVGTGWLASSHESVRLVALDALARNGSTWALDRMLDALDDPFPMNRQFASRSLKKWLGLPLTDVGYRYFLTRRERRPLITRLRKLLSTR